MATPLNKEAMLEAFKALDQKLNKPITLTIGGGGAMLLAYDYPLATHDIDAFPHKVSIEELDIYVKQVAKDLGLVGDWLNPYFSTFSHTLPKDYKNRLKIVFQGKFIEALALGREDLLIMKCFAHRPKDIGHAKTLIKQGANTELVESRILELLERKLPGAQEAIDFLDDVMEQL